MHGEEERERILTLTRLVCMTSFSSYSLAFLMCSWCRCSNAIFSSSSVSRTGFCCKCNTNRRLQQKNSKTPAAVADVVNLGLANRVEQLRVKRAIVVTQRIVAIMVNKGHDRVERKRLDEAETSSCREDLDQLVAAANSVTT